jgi:hypothetical protein
MLNAPFFVGIGFALFGVCLLRYALRNDQQALSSHSWPTVRGTLLEVDLWGRRNVGGAMTEAKHLNVKYEYEVRNTTYTATDVGFYTLEYPETTDFAGNHSVNSVVTVHHDPMMPTNAVLIPGPRKDNKRFSDMILASLGIICGVTVSVSGWLGAIG